MTSDAKASRGAQSNGPGAVTSAVTGELPAFAPGATEVERAGQ